MILAIDPGTTASGLVEYDPRKQRVSAVSSEMDNHKVRTAIGEFVKTHGGVVVCEMVASYGMAVGAETFETVRWIGRFEECAGAGRFDTVFRLQVKQALCHDSRAKDANIRQAILDRFGGKDAKGTRNAPGPLFGVSKHAWSALAVALTWAQLHSEQEL